MRPGKKGVSLLGDIGQVEKNQSLEIYGHSSVTKIPEIINLIREKIISILVHGCLVLLSLDPQHVIVRGTRQMCLGNNDRDRKRCWPQYPPIAMPPIICLLSIIPHP